MDILDATDAKRQFDEVITKAQLGPVRISKNGEPVAAVISAAEYAQFEALKEDCLRRVIQRGIADLRAGKVVEGKTVMDKLRKRVSG